ncbi:MAG: hypothetical protein E7324_04875 [Clostridiales bacterium]|nr:hypothetical protein [Clostridiales bacterium]
MKRISVFAYDKLNDAARIAKRDQWFARMEKLFAGRDEDPFVFTLDGVVPRPKDDKLAYTNPEEWVVQCLELLAAQPECTENRFSPDCVEYPIYGVHFIDKMLGAHVYNHMGQWHADYLDTPVGELQTPDLEKDETWMLARRAAQAFLDADVKLPLFGMPTLSSALNIYVNLYGGEGLAVMMEDEEAAAHDLKVINDLIRTLHRWYIDHIPVRQLQPVISWSRTQPPGFGQLCGCTCQLLSGAMYGELVAPLDDALLSEYPGGGMIHLCGSHTQHIPTFREMKHLKALQLNDRAAEDLALYLEGLREDQILYVNPCPGMPVERIIALSGGKRIILCARMDAPEKK